MKENYFEKSFLINAVLISQRNLFSLQSLINSNFIIYMLIHIKLVDKVCQKLKIQSILLAKEKLIWDYDEKLFKKIITYKILLNLTIESHKKLIMSMLITDIEHHETILSKLWMNKNEILLNMQHLIWFDLIWIHTLLWHRFKFDSWEKLCYVYWMNKILWERKSLVNYTMTSRHRNNKIDTILSVMNL